MRILALYFMFLACIGLRPAQAFEKVYDIAGGETDIIQVAVSEDKIYWISNSRTGIWSTSLQTLEEQQEVNDPVLSFDVDRGTFIYSLGDSSVWFADRNGKHQLTSHGCSGLQIRNGDYIYSIADPADDYHSCRVVLVREGSPVIFPVGRSVREASLSENFAAWTEYTDSDSGIGFSEGFHPEGYAFDDGVYDKSPAASDSGFFWTRQRDGRYDVFEFSDHSSRPVTNTPDADEQDLFYRNGILVWVEHSSEIDRIWAYAQGTQVLVYESTEYKISSPKFDGTVMVWRETTRRGVVHSKGKFAVDFVSPLAPKVKISKARKTGPLSFAATVQVELYSDSSYHSCLWKEGETESCSDLVPYSVPPGTDLQNPYQVEFEAAAEVTDYGVYYFKYEFWSGPYKGTSNTVSVIFGPGIHESRSGWWYNAEMPGTGVALEAQDSTVFFAWFAYDEGGSPRWYSAGGPLNADRSFSGSLLSWYGWNFGEEDYFAPTPEPVGTVEANFRDDELLELDMTFRGLPVTLRLTRFMKDFAPGPQDYRDITGWWWSPEYSGMGWFLEAAGGKLAAVWYTYDESHQSSWMTTSGPLSLSECQYSGVLDSWSGGQCAGCEYSGAPEYHPGAGGEFSFLFDESHAVMFLRGESLPVERFQIP